MNIFEKTYFLTQSCLGEITSNFRRVYLLIDKKTENIIIYFYLEKEINTDIESIMEEIMPNFEMLIEQESSCEINKISERIIFGCDQYLKNESNKNILVEIFRKKEQE